MSPYRTQGERAPVEPPPPLYCESCRCYDCVRFRGRERAAWACWEAPVYAVVMVLSSVLVWWLAHVIIELRRLAP